MKETTSKPKAPVLVTGGAGFIGSHLCRALIQNGERVVCLDDFSTGSRENIADLIGTEGFFLRAVPVQIVNSHIPYSCIYHLAFPTGSGSAVGMFGAGSEGTRQTLQLATQHATRIVVASSAAVYSYAPPPDNLVDEWDAPVLADTRNAAALAKIYTEALCFSYHRAYGTDVRVARLFNVYGPGARSGVVNRFIEQALAGETLQVHHPQCRRGFLYVSDAVGALMRLGRGEGYSGEVFNVGRPCELSLYEVALLVNCAVGRAATKDVVVSAPGVNRPCDPPRLKPDISKIFERAHWAPRVKFSDGLLRTVRSYRRVSRAV